MAEIRVYASYAWKVEEQTKILDKLVAACSPHAIRILRDKNEIHYRESIQAYMNQLVAGDAIILVLSDAYFKSPYCMYELCEIYKRKDFLKRVYPIVTAGTRFHKFKERVLYIRYWQQEVKKLKKYLKSISIGNMSTKSLAEMKEYEAFARMIDDLQATLNDMNALTQNAHLDTDFAALIAQLKKDGFIDLKECQTQLAVQKSQKDFERMILEKFCTVLDGMQAETLRNTLYKKLAKSTSDLTTDVIGEWWQPNNYLQKITHFLEIVESCLEDVSQKMSLSPKTPLCQQVRKMIGWILLPSISQEWLNQHYSREKHFLEVPVQYIAVVEILAAAAAAAAAAVEVDSLIKYPALLQKAEGANIFGEHWIAIEKNVLKIPECGWQANNIVGQEIPECGWQANDIVEQVGLAAWKVEIKETKKKLSHVDWDTLFTVLEGKQKYLAVNMLQDGHPLLDDHICYLLSTKLRKELKSIDIFRFGIDINGHSTPLIVSEGELFGKIYLFLEMMEKYENP